MALAIQLQAPVPTVRLVSPKPAALRPNSIRAEDDWLRAIVSEDRHLNVLVHCTDLPMASVIAEIGELCGRTVWTSLVPVLQLPEHDSETLMIGDISMMSLLQQVELSEWLDRFGETSQGAFVQLRTGVAARRTRPVPRRSLLSIDVVTLTADPIRH